MKSWLATRRRARARDLRTRAGERLRNAGESRVFNASGGHFACVGGKGDGYARLAQA